MVDEDDSVQVMQRCRNRSCVLETELAGLDAGLVGAEVRVREENNPSLTPECLISMAGGDAHTT